MIYSSPASPDSNGDCTVPDDHTVPDRPRANLLDLPTRLFDRYRVKHQIGRGGMGVVLLALDEELELLVAVKLIPDSVVRDTEAIIDLKREVIRGMALLHPNIVRTHNLERDATRAAIIMEYVEGQTLAELKVQQADGCFGPSEVLPWLEQLCPVLDYAHGEAKIVHRDLKPGNIMLTQEGRIKVADFGISSQISNSLSRLSEIGPVSGTPPYMSPQQALGQRPTHLDDIYSLGATLYELLTGKPPFFRGDILAQVLHTPPATLAERLREFNLAGRAPLPPVWEQTIAACLAKEPDMRPQNAREILARLKGEYRDESLIATKSDGAISPARPAAPELVKYSFRPTATSAPRPAPAVSAPTAFPSRSFRRRRIFRRLLRGLWSAIGAVFGGLFRCAKAMQVWVWLGLGLLALACGGAQVINHWKDRLLWFAPPPGTQSADATPEPTPSPHRTRRAKVPAPTPSQESWHRYSIAGLGLDLPVPLQASSAPQPATLQADVTSECFRGQMGGHTIYLRHARSGALSDSTMQTWVGVPVGNLAANAGIQVLPGRADATPVNGLLARRTDFVWTMAKPRIRARCVVLEQEPDAWVVEYHAPESDAEAERNFMRIVASAQPL